MGRELTVHFDRAGGCVGKTWKVLASLAVVSHIMYMRKRIGIVLAVLITALIGGLIFRILLPHELAYKGKPLSYWVDPWTHGGQESPEEVAAALKAMSGRAIPYLISRLRWKPRPIILRLHKQFPNFPPLLRYVQGS